MAIEDYRDLDCEANAHTPQLGTHHLHIPRHYDAAKLLRIVQKEALDQLEPGQNLGVYPYPDNFIPKVD